MSPAGPAEREDARTVAAMTVEGSGGGESLRRLFSPGEESGEKRLRGGGVEGRKLVKRAKILRARGRAGREGPGGKGVESERVGRSGRREGDRHGVKRGWESN